MVSVPKTVLTGLLYPVISVLSLGIALPRLLYVYVVMRVFYDIVR